MPRRSGRSGSVVVLAALGLLLLAAPSRAHGTDPGIVSVVDAVTPPLPRAVVVQVETNVAAQVVVDNPTALPLEVLAPTGEVFLRISRAGVIANLGSPEFAATSSPAGAAPRSRGPDRFVRVSGGSSWGWYDHRLHPARLRAPVDGRATRLGAFEVPLRYGGVPTTLRGHLEYRPVRGAFEAAVRSVPPGLAVSVLQGRLPGLFVTARVPLTVLGRDGEPFLRSDGRALQVNTASRTYVEDREARGLTAAPPGVTPRWQPVGGASYTWLDGRLGYPLAEPPASVLARSRPTTVLAWRVPVVEGGSTLLLTGDLRWVPAGDRSRSVGHSARPALAQAAAALGAASVLAGIAVVVRRRRPGARAG
jgi:hypothetical protein